MYQLPSSFGGAGESSPPAPSEEEGGTATQPSPAEITPESKFDNLNILIENNLINGSKFIDLGHAQESLGEISKELDKLLNS